MRLVDFAPLNRSSIGFDRLFDLMEDAIRLEQPDSYQHYNIEKTGEDAYRITLAVAGYEKEELAITSQANLLIVAGRKAQESAGEYLYQGIAGRAFERRFSLADHVRVTGASLHNGLLAIDLTREVPEAAKPRRIEIANSNHQHISGDKAA